MILAEDLTLDTPNEFGKADLLHSARLAKLRGLPGTQSALRARAVTAPSRSSMNGSTVGRAADDEVGGGDAKCRSSPGIWRGGNPLDFAPLRFSTRSSVVRSRTGVRHYTLPSRSGYIRNADKWCSRAAARVAASQTSRLGGQVAQLVEQRTENPRVGGSIPSLAIAGQQLSYPLGRALRAPHPSLLAAALAVATRETFPRVSVVDDLAAPKRRASSPTAQFRGETSSPPARRRSPSSRAVTSK